MTPATGLGPSPMERGAPTATQPAAPAGTDEAAHSAAPNMPTLDDLLEPPAGFTETVGSPAGTALGQPPTAGQVLNGYLFVFVAAFLISILATPLVRRLALRSGVVDWPDQARKAHREPVAYLGGVAVFLGLVGGIVASYFLAGYRPGLAPVPINIVFAMAVIMFTGLADDIFRWDPNLKLAGQFFTAAIVALDEQIGGRVAAGLLRPLERGLASLFDAPLLDLANFDVVPGSGVCEVDLIYIAGAVVVASFVLGACNAANLIDGLDGLLTGSVAVMAAALLVISVMVATRADPKIVGHLSGARVVLCFALLGATLGFLPHNFKPATIFLGDAGSLLLGFCVIVIVLLLGETGQTHLVFAGLIVFGVPILDTTLAIIRRRLNGTPISAPDANHLHHMLKRTRLGVLGAVFVLYGVSVIFALVAILLVFLRARVVYALVLVLGGFIVVTGIKAARRKQRQVEVERVKTLRGVGTAPEPAERKPIATAGSAPPPRHRPCPWPFRRPTPARCAESPPRLGADNARAGLDESRA